MTRLEALEAVAEAARKYIAATVPRECQRTYEAMRESVAALDALPAEPQPQGETVTLAVWMEPGCGDVFWAVAGSDNDECPEAAFYHRRTVTLHLDPEAPK